MALNEGRETRAQICGRRFDEGQPGPHVRRNGYSAPRHCAARNRLADRQIASQTFAGYGARCAKPQCACRAKAFLGGLVANGAARNVTLLLCSEVSVPGYLFVDTPLVDPADRSVPHSVG